MDLIAELKSLKSLKSHENKMNGNVLKIRWYYRVVFLYITIVISNASFYFRSCQENSTELYLKSYL